MRRGLGLLMALAVVSAGSACWSADPAPRPARAQVPAVAPLFELQHNAFVGGKGYGWIEDKARSEGRDMATFGTLVAGVYSLYPVTDHDPAFLHKPSIDEFCLRDVKIHTKDMTVLRQFTFRYNNFPDQNRLWWSGGTTYDPAEKWELRDVVDYQPGVCRSGNYAMGMVAALDAGADVGMITGYCVTWDERRTTTANAKWQRRHGCVDLESAWVRPDEGPLVEKYFD